MQTVNFFDLPLVSITPEELPVSLASWLQQGTWLVTVNAEILLRAKRDARYAKLLHQADVLLPDGFGPVLWSRGLISHRFPGVDLTALVLDLAEQHQFKTLCVVSRDGLSRGGEILAALLQRWPKLPVKVLECDAQSVPDTQLSDMREAQVVLVNFGVPQQDQWLAQLKRELPGMKIGIGVGGTFDFWTTHAKRAPVWLRHVGLESLWRLIHQPWRTVRVWNALVAFSWHALWHPPVAEPK